MSLRGLSTRSGKEWGGLYDRHRQEKASEKQAATTVWRRFQHWRSKGSHLGQLRAARKIEQQASQGYQSVMKGAVDYAKDVVWRQELQAQEQARWERDRQERAQGRGPERERDYGPSR